MINYPIGVHVFCPPPPANYAAIEWWFATLLGMKVGITSSLERGLGLVIKLILWPNALHAGVHLGFFLGVQHISLR